jgi:uncharacterized protein YndB with AHSA1/START domain
METSPLEIKTQIGISRPPDVVFDAIVDPAKMSNYFISRSSGRMEEGKTLIWEFPEFDVKIPVRVGRIEKDRYVSYYWEADNKQDLLVEITLEPFKVNSTLVTVTEKSRPNDSDGIRWLKGNTEGWANFLACLKAYLEYGINLRKGAFDFLSTKD